MFTAWKAYYSSHMHTKHTKADITMEVFISLKKGKMQPCQLEDCNINSLCLQAVSSVPFTSQPQEPTKLLFSRRNT